MASTSYDDFDVKELSWWDRRNTTEKRLTIALGITLLISIILAFAYVASLKSNRLIVGKEIDKEEETEEKGLCLTPECIHVSSQIINNLDTTVDPCDDFYAFACGGYLQKTIIPHDKISVSPFTNLQDSVLDKLKSIFEEPNNSKDLKAFKLMKRLYKICMDTESLESDGYYTLVYEILKPLGGWPVLENKFWHENAFEWKNFTYQLRRMGLENIWFLNAYVASAEGKDLKQLQISMPYLSWYQQKEFVEGFSNKIVESYYEYMVDVALMLGADMDYARKELRKVVEFEMELSKLSLGVRNNENVTDIYNTTTIGDLQNMYPGLDWLEFINNIINLPNLKLKQDEIVSVKNPNQIEEWLSLVNRTPKRILANYGLFQVINYVAPYLPEEIKYSQSEFLKNIYDPLGSTLPRWKECVYAVAEKFFVESGSVYAKRYIDSVIKNNVEEIVKYLHVELNETLDDFDWMDENTKEKAIDKVDSLKFHIAYSDKDYSKREIENRYKKITITSNTYLMFSLNMEQYYTDYLFSLLHKTNDGNVMYSTYTDEYQSWPIFSGVFYNPYSNKIEVPPGILQGVFFDSQHPNYLNYGGIGYVIGQQLVKSIIGQQLINDEWWTDKTEKAFLEKAKCFTSKNQNDSGLMVDDINIDKDSLFSKNIGIKLAYNAYQAWVEENGDEQLLPGLNYTQNQMFWIIVANTECEKFKNAEINDLHNLEASMWFENTERFGEDFNCPLETKMNPKEKCQFSTKKEKEGEEGGEEGGEEAGEEEGKEDEEEEEGDEEGKNDEGKK